MILRRGKSYHAVIYVEGRQVWRTLKTDDSKLASIRYGELLKEEKFRDKNLWENFRKEYMGYAKANHSAETYKGDEIWMKKFEDTISPRFVTDLTVLALERYKQERVKDKKSPATVNREMSLLKAMINKASEWGYLPFQNLRTVRRVKEQKRNTTYFEVKQIEVIRKSVKEIEYLVRIDMALYTGLRRRELLMIRWEDVDFDKGLIHLKGGPGRPLKDFEERTIQMHPILKVTLLKWRRRSKNPLILGSIRPQGLSLWFKRLFRRIKLSGSLHTTRHTVGTHLTRERGITEAQHFLGHSSSKTTERYSHQKSEVVPVKSLPY